jgi:hypothetical protein
MAHAQAAEADHGHTAGEGAPARKQSDKVVALLISVLTLILAFSDALGTATQTSALSYNVEAADTWAFYQAKTIRMVTLRTAAEALQLDLNATTDGTARAAMQKRIDGWLKDAARYESEPATNEGARELEVRAANAEHNRDRALAAYHHYETAAAALSIGIVLASAAVITGIFALAFISGTLGIVGLVFMSIGLFAPHALHLF